MREQFVAEALEHRDAERRGTIVHAVLGVVAVAAAVGTGEVASRRELEAQRFGIVRQRRPALAFAALDLGADPFLLSAEPREPRQFRVGRTVHEPRRQGLDPTRRIRERIEAYSEMAGRANRFRKKKTDALELPFAAKLKADDSRLVERLVPADGEIQFTVIVAGVERSDANFEVQVAVDRARARTAQTRSTGSRRRSRRTKSFSPPTIRRFPDPSGPSGPLGR